MRSEAPFLSDEWIADLDAAARRSEALTAWAQRLVVEQRVTGGPDGERCYHVVLGDGAPRVVTGRAEAPDVTLTADDATARAIHEGRDNAQRALAEHRLHLSGNLDAVVASSDALAALRDVFSTPGTTEGSSEPARGPDQPG